jgi:hypothetical protein
VRDRRVELARERVRVAMPLASGRCPVARSHADTAQAHQAPGRPVKLPEPSQRSATATGSLPPWPLVIPAEARKRAVCSGIQGGAACGFVWIPAYQAMRKLGEILQTVAQSKNFRDFFDSARSEASKKRTKRGRVKTPNSFHTG